MGPPEPSGLLNLIFNLIILSNVSCMYLWYITYCLDGYIHIYILEWLNLEVNKCEIWAGNVTQ